MKILVTGGAGFIGSNIADGFIGKGHKVVIIDDLSSGKIHNVNSKAKFVKIDINSRKVESIFKKEKFEIVCHHAAQIDVRKSVADPQFDAKVNILGSLNILENARKYRVKKVIFASSGGTIYGECGSKAPDEKSPAKPLSPYGVSKFAVETYIKYFREIHNLKYTILRYGNVYGPRQDPHGEAGVVAIFSEKLLFGKSVNIFGDGKQMRDYVYIGDVVRANVSALTKGNNEIINIGTGKPVSVNELFRKMADITCFEGSPAYLPARKGELLKSFLNINKAKNVLGWMPENNLYFGLKNTIQYFAERI